MIYPKKYKTATILGVAILVAMALAAGLSSFKLQPGRSLPIAAILDALRQMQSPYAASWKLPFDPFRLLASCLWVLLIISVVLLIVSPQARKELFKRIVSYLVLALLAYGAISVLQPLFQPGENLITPPEISDFSGESSTGEELPTPPDYVFNPPQWIVIATTVFILLVPMLIVWLGWNYFAPKKSPAPETSLKQLTQSAQTALDELDSGGDVKDTVLRCYRDMSNTLQQQRGLHRRQGMTPREFERYLAQSGLRTEHIRRLTRLFESVRYGKKSPGRRDEQEARDCLNAITRTYGTAV